MVHFIMLLVIWDNSHVLCVLCWCDVNVLEEQVIADLKDFSNNFKVGWRFWVVGIVCLLHVVFATCNADWTILSQLSLLLGV